MSTRIPCLPITLGLLLLAASTASAQRSSSMRTDDRISVYSGGHFGGEAELHVDSFVDVTIESDLDPSPLFGLRWTHPFFDYVTMSTDLRIIRWRRDVRDDDERATLLDFSLAPALRYVFEAGSVSLEPYLAVPLGLTINVLPDDPPGEQGRGSAGLHIGIMGGLAVMGRSGFGGFLELGWMHHSVFDGDDDTDTRIRLGLDQMALHVGASIAF